MNVIRKAFVLCSAVCALMACTKNEDALDKERTAIDNFLKSKGEYTVVKDVYKYVTNADRDGYEDAKLAAKGDVVEFYYEGYTFETGLSTKDGEITTNLIFATNHPEILAFLGDQDKMGSMPAWNTELWPDAPVEAKLGSTSMVKGLEIGLPDSREGDVLWLIFASDLGFEDKELGIVPASKSLAYRIYINKVTKR